MFYASDYFERLYEYAEQLIRSGKAYVDGLTADEIREYRGTLTEPGSEQPVPRPAGRRRTSTCSAACGRASSPTARTCCARRSTWRRRTSTCATRRCTASGTPRTTAPATRGASTRCTTTRIRSPTRSRASRTRSARWSSRITGRCTTGCIDVTAERARSRPQQIEFARLNLNYTVMSKRKLLQLVEEQHVDGWDDPRMPTIAGLRRRGYTPEAIREFCARIGVAKKENVIDIALLEHTRARGPQPPRAARDGGAAAAEGRASRTIPKARSRRSTSSTTRRTRRAGTRQVPFSRVLYIERDDFMEDPPKKFFRLSPGTRGAAALRVHHHVHRRGQGRQPANRRAALHLRPGDARRRRAATAAR